MARARKHNLKKNVNYAKKHKIKAEDILAKDITELQSMGKEELRQALVVVNQKANKELARISRMTDVNKAKLIDKNPLLQDRIIFGTKKNFVRFSTTGYNTKTQYIKELTNRKLFFDKTPNPKEQRENRLYRDKIIKEYIRSYAGMEYDEIEGKKPSLEKLGKILQRLEDDHYIAAHAGTSGYSLGSDPVRTIAFTIAMEHPTWGLDKLYEKIEAKLKEEEETVALQQDEEDDFMDSNDEP